MSRRRRPRDGGRWAAWTGARRPSRGLVVAFGGTGGGCHGTPTSPRPGSLSAHAARPGCRAPVAVRGRCVVSCECGCATHGSWLVRAFVRPGGRAPSVAAPGALRRRAFVGCTRTHTHTPHTEPPPMATYTETDDASRREGVAARGLGACVWARAPKPEQTLSLQGSRYVDLSAFPAVFRRPVRWAKRCGRRPIDLNPPNLKRSTPGRVYR